MEGGGFLLCSIPHGLLKKGKSIVRMIVGMVYLLPSRCVPLAKEEWGDVCSSGELTGKGYCDLDKKMVVLGLLLPILKVIHEVELEGD